MTLFTAAALLTIWPWHHKPVPPAQVQPPAVLPAPSPAIDDPIWSIVSQSVTEHCYVISEADPRIIIFIADDGMFQIGSDCYHAFKNWEEVPSKEKFPVA